MVVKAKAPQEDPQTKARREQAESQARERQIRGIRTDVSRETDAILRRFGNRAAFAGSPSIAAAVGSPGGGRPTQGREGFVIPTQRSGRGGSIMRAL